MLKIYKCPLLKIIRFIKTSFLSGVNSSFIEKYYVQYLTNPSSLPNSWKLFFDGLGDEQDIITQNINGPSWAPEKIISEKNLKNIIGKKERTKPSRI